MICLKCKKEIDKDSEYIKSDMFGEYMHKECFEKDKIKVHPNEDI